MLTPLSLKDLDWVYPYLLAYFPKEEIKPKAWLEKMLKNDEYALYAYQKEANYLAFAFCYTKSEPALLDYFFVLKEVQGKGIGSIFLKALEKTSDLVGGLIVEAESPDCAENQSSYEKRMRRIRFYQRLGYKKTELTPTIFGTTYHLFISKNVALDQLNLRQNYQKIYQAMVPLPLQKDNLLI